VFALPLPVRAGVRHRLRGGVRGHQVSRPAPGGALQMRRCCSGCGLRCFKDATESCEARCLFSNSSCIELAALSSINKVAPTYLCMAHAFVLPFSCHSLPPCSFSGLQFGPVPFPARIPPPAAGPLPPPCRRPLPGCPRPRRRGAHAPLCHGVG
jgi:hypothetical protein